MGLHYLSLTFMTIRTLVIGYEPAADITTLKPRDRRNQEYFSTLLACHDFGELHFAAHDAYREKLEALNPLFVVVFDESKAHEVRATKKDVLLYVTDAPSSIFYRKAEIENRQAKQRKTFRELADFTQRVKEKGEEEVTGARKFAAMDFDDMYNMIVQAIISDRNDLRQQAFELINRNDVNPMFVWIRIKIICDVWQSSDAKGRQEFLDLAMQDHINNGLAHRMEDFTDEDGQVYHQYMFHRANGEDAGYIRRIPVAKPGQKKYAYETLLDKYETPIGPRMMLEAGLLKKERDGYLTQHDDNIANSSLKPAEKH